MAVALLVAACAAPPAEQKDSLAATIPAASDSSARIDSAKASGPAAPASGASAKQREDTSRRVLGRDSAIQFDPSRPRFPTIPETARPPRTPPR